MKKTLIAFFALTSAVNAASVGYDSMTAQQQENVVLAWDFSDGTNELSKGSISENFSLNEDKTAAVITTNGNHPWTTSLSNSVSNGNFTLSFDIYSFEANNWQSLVALYSGSAGNAAGDDRCIQIGVTTAGQLSVFNKVGGATGFANINTDGNLGTGLFSSYTGSATLTLVSDMTDTKTLTLYIDGQQVGQHTNWVAAEGDSPALKGLQFGALFGSESRKFPEAEIGNITLWNKALSASEVKGLIVPEPATATLSLLALAGLAARRRRK